ncbi:MAG: hypothetical protein COU85_00170 [Candidatus Portnoybacteria bacterium CG10_big_fil_rev_8_21_14_0_10_44_7]|uniref:Uncharacterized protein n=1 Tax=Candidatus Portnoybacteria bacterium CG10_big_fil_rev_8_21_14_0_10_44_7 TaxID=1974816 RepID=A0A2M8KJK3_9BACT|nr:MAG: hypothetical protein COU85_00170 [Candidatus Portnoybacteria bacterium CG10_big_fil_rev_8_21_14_0_10_44_7]
MFRPQAHLFLIPGGEIGCGKPIKRCKNIATPWAFVRLFGPNERCRKCGLVFKQRYDKDGHEKP